MAEPNERPGGDSDDLDSLLEEYEKDTESEKKVKVSDHLKPDTSQLNTKVLNYIRKQEEKEQREAEKDMLNNAIQQFRERDEYKDVPERLIRSLIVDEAFQNEEFLKAFRSGNMATANKAIAKLAEDRVPDLKREERKKEKEAVKAAVSGISETKDDRDDEITNEKLNKLSDYEFDQLKRSLARY